MKNTFPKTERLHSKKIIQELFQKGSFFYSYPFKVIFLTSEEAPSHQVLISVSKRKFKNAVDRNLIKRRIREAYRLNKHVLYSEQEAQPSLSIAYIYTGKEIPTYQFIETKLSKSLRRLIVEVEKANR
ncbi:MAG: ribonuclease P protein component [Roseivirga sp.]|nr:ribonuclease P protein component [Roseivirga sp.]